MQSYDGIRLIIQTATWWKQKLFSQASSAEGDVPGQKAGSDITESDDAGKDEQYEEAFSKMKKAAGKCINFTSAIRFSDVYKHNAALVALYIWGLLLHCICHVLKSFKSLIA